MVSDAALELSMLGLFALPIYLQMKNAKAVQQHSPTRQLSEVMSRNMKFSLLLVSIDIITLIIDSTILIVTSARIQNGDPTAEVLVLGGNFCLIIDTIAAVVIVHIMTVGWMPLSVRQRFITSSKTQSAVQNEHYEQAEKEQQVVVLPEVE